MTIDRMTFYQYVNNAPFAGRLSPQQRDGLEKILSHWELSPYTDIRWLAYMLATVFHETAQTMQPIQERGTSAYLKGKPYYPYIGQGLVQITWKENYAKFGVKLGDPLKWPVALDIMFKGMTTGAFTGKRLSTYFNKTAEDPRGARKIINGTDKAGLIADYYTNFLGALTAATASEAPTDVVDGHQPGQATSLLQDTSVLSVVGSTGSVGVLGTLISYVDSVQGVIILCVLGVAAMGCLTFYLTKRKQEKYTQGV